MHFAFRSSQLANSKDRQTEKNNAITRDIICSVFVCVCVPVRECVHMCIYICVCVFEEERKRKMDKPIYTTQGAK